MRHAAAFSYFLGHALKIRNQRRLSSRLSIPMFIGTPCRKVTYNLAPSPFKFLCSLCLKRKYLEQATREKWVQGNFFNVFFSSINLRVTSRSKQSQCANCIMPISTFLVSAILRNLAIKMSQHIVLCVSNSAKFLLHKLHTFFCAQNICFQLFANHKKNFRKIT